MKNINKWGQLAVAVMLAVGMQSCQKPDTHPSGTGYPILFNCSDFETRAVADLASIQAGGFKVYAYFAGNEGYAGFDKAVTYTDAVWSYEDIEYWIPGTEYNFRAFYPQGPIADEYTLAVDNNTAAQAYTISDYDVLSQIDLMTANATRRVDAAATAPDDGSVVNLEFQHLLACIVVELKSEITGVTVSEVSLGSIAQTGTYSSDEDWTSSATTSIKYTSNVALETGATDYADVTANGILVIPETTGGSHTLTITTNTKAYEIVLPTVTWEPGHKYTYTATIKQENIVFNEPKVAIWDDENATGSVIIK